MPDNHQKQILSPKELSQYLKISVNTIYSWINQGRIPYIKIGRLVRFDLVEINDWVDNKKIEVSDKI